MLMLRPPQLDVQIGTLHLTDKLEWDLSSSLTPELFAATLVRDLSLSSSAAPLIAHALHEELLRLKRSCLELGLLSADDATRNRRGAKALEGVWREWNDADKFGPKVERLSLDELDRVEADRERAARCVALARAVTRAVSHGTDEVVRPTGGKSATGRLAGRGSRRVHGGSPGSCHAACNDSTSTFSAQEARRSFCRCDRCNLWIAVAPGPRQLLHERLSRRLHSFSYCKSA